MTIGWIRAGAALCLTLVLCTADAEVLTFKLVVKLRDKLGDVTGKPFADVGGFIIRRSNAEFKDAQCPDQSDAKGEILCRLQCDAADPDLRLQVVSPTKERARIVGTYSPPSSRPIDVLACKLSTVVPIEFVYRTSEVVFSDFGASNPAVFSAITTGSAGTGFTIKPFSEAVPLLQSLAKDERNRNALLEAAGLAQAYQARDSKPGAQRIEAAEFQKYAAGLKSVVLQAAVSDSIGPAASTKVKISPDAADFHRSVGIVEKELAAKAILSEREILLSNDVRKLRLESRLPGEKLHLLDRSATMHQ